MVRDGRTIQSISRKCYARCSYRDVPQREKWMPREKERDRERKRQREERERESMDDQAIERERNRGEKERV